MQTDHTSPRRRAVALLAVVLAVTATGPAHADTYILKNGARIQGGEPEPYKVGKEAWLEVPAAFGTVRFRKSDLRRRLKVKAEDGPLRVMEIVTTLVRGTVERTRDGETWTRVQWPEPGLTSDADEASLPINAPNAFVAPGDRVRTGADGVLDVDIGWGVVHVAPDSEIAFVETEGPTLRVLGGRAGARLPNLPDGAEFRVETPQTSMGVRGTTFVVSVGDATRVAVGEGVVDVAGLSIAEGQAAESAAGGAPTRDVPDLDEERLLERTAETYAIPHFDWVQIHAGRYVRGNGTGNESPDLINHGPEQRVRLPEFEISRVEVTNAQFAEFERWMAEHRDHRFCHPSEPADERHQRWRFMDGTEVPEAGRGDEHPVCGISWFTAYAFAAWCGVRLPSESQWEYVARAGADTDFPWGQTRDGFEDHEWWELNSGDTAYDPWNPPPEIGGTHSPEWSAWLAEIRETARTRPRPVGTLRPNAFGVHDMLGNVAEYVWDLAHQSYEGAPLDGSAWLDRKTAMESEGSLARLSRGDAWRGDAGEPRPVWFRAVRPPYRPEGTHGIRVVRPGGMSR